MVISQASAILSMTLQFGFKGLGIHHGKLSPRRGASLKKEIYKTI